MAVRHAEDGSWQLALSLIAAWREADGAARQDVFEQRLAEVAAEGAAAVENAVLGLTALGNMFIELCADCAGRPVETVLEDAATLEWDDRLQEQRSQSDPPGTTGT